MTETTTTLDPTTLPDTATEDAAALAGSMSERDDEVIPDFEVPEQWARKGFEKLPYAGGMWGVWNDRYIYKPLRAWDQAQTFVDTLIARTSGHVFSFVSGVMLDIHHTSQLRPADLIEDKDILADPARARAEFAPMLVRVYRRRMADRWAELLQAVPNLAPYDLAKRAIQLTEVRRLMSPADQAKADDDPSKDHGGPIFDVKGAGAVETFYRGRRDQLLRVGLAAIWGSCGDFFVQR